MALNVWTQRSGYSFGTFQERQIFDVVLPVTNDTGVSYSVISGQLPGGLRINENRIVGTPYEVPRTTSYTFCIRASKNGSISDRTFSIEIESLNGPEFITPAGDLPVGPAQQYYTLDSTYVDYQIEVVDLNISPTQRLSFFIAKDDGELPPGLVLTKDGRIVGFVQPALSIKPGDGSGTYDESTYDTVAFDFAYRPSNGYDSFFYDSVFFDYNTQVKPPKKLNRNYEFNVSVSDGDVTVKRRFKIFVVGDDYFRADNTFLSESFTADVTYLRKPIWLTPNYLGFYRANNYITVKLETYDTENIIISLESLNPDNTVSTLPPGMTFDANSSQIYGVVPYQPAITKTYKFTLTATRFSDKGEVASTSKTFTVDIIGEIDSIINWDTPSDLGAINANFVSTLKVKATTTISNSLLLYHVVDGHLPPGLNLELDGEIVGKVNQFYNPTTDAIGLTRFYDVVNNKKVFTAFDNNETRIDRLYTFTVEVNDQYGITAVRRTFTLLIDTPNKILYSNIRVKPFLKLSQRSYWKDFINDTNIFTPESIYRTNDPSFGLQTDLSMLIYAGIETKEAAAYVGAMGLNHKRKRFQFGSVKKATAYDPGTRNAIYEVVYIEMIDPLEPRGQHLPLSFKTLNTDQYSITVDRDNSFWSNSISVMQLDGPNAERPNPIITVDSQGYFASNPKPNTYFPSSVTNWQKRLSSVGASERNYLPLWMRSIQEGSKAELGFKLAIPLCFCKVGSANDIILNIKYSNFNFSLIDYTVDRYIIDSVEGLPSDKYLVFRNDRITI